jgi:hypothetical protein
MSLTTWGEISGITLNERKWCKMAFSICLIPFEAWWETIGIQALRKTIQQRVIHFGYPKIHLVSHISEWLHITNVKEAYRSSNKVNYIRQMLKYNDWCTSVDYMEETLSYLALEGWYDIDNAKVFNILFATDKRRLTRRAHLLCLQTIQDEPIMHPVSQQVYHLKETHVCVVCRSIELTSLTDASEHFGIPNFGQLFCAQIDQDWG